MQLPVPEHFDPPKVGEVWRVPYQERAALAETWAKRFGLRPATEDRSHVCLVLVDCQNTFCIPGLDLFVTGRSGRGAVEDNVRICEFIYRNLQRLSEIDATLDTHLAMQIFHSVFLIDEAGAHPPPLTVISLEDVESGRWRVNPDVAASLGGQARLQKHLIHYCRKLGEGGKYQLMVWPYHALLGGIGHALVSALEEACFFHAIARASPTVMEIKGNNPLVENYSVLKPEVLQGADGQPIAEKNTRLIGKLLQFDAIIVAGQAKSHCVAWTVDDLWSEIQAQDPKLAGKVYLLTDCTSPIVVPGVVDFSDQADAAFGRFARAGMHLVESTVPMEEWPDFPSLGRAVPP